MTSLTAPIQVGDRVVGVAGVDLSPRQRPGPDRPDPPLSVGRAALVSNRGTVVASNRGGDEAGSAAEGAAAAVAADAVESGKPAQRTTGGNLLVAAPITVAAGQQWALLVEIPQSAILADAHALRTTILIGAVLTMLVVGLATLLVARRVVAPLDALRERMEEIADGDGDLTLRVDETPADEIGRLGAAFNRSS